MTCVLNNLSTLSAEWLYESSGDFYQLKCFIYSLYCPGLVYIDMEGKKNIILT